jgi:hypothetical protein
LVAYISKIFISIKKENIPTKIFADNVFLIFLRESKKRRRNKYNIGAIDRKSVRGSTLYSNFERGLHRYFCEL